MTQTYVGMVATGVVTVVGDGSRELPGGPFGWGKLSPLGGALAKAIVLDLTGDPEVTERYYMRFKWRTVANWKTDQDFTLAESVAREALEDIRATEKASAGERSKIATEAPPVANEGGIGPGGVPFSPIERKS